MCEQAGGEMQVQTEHLKSLNRVVREQKPFPKGCLIVVETWKIFLPEL